MYSDSNIDWIVPRGQIDNMPALAHLFIEISTEHTEGLTVNESLTLLINSLAPRKCGSNYKSIVFKHRIVAWGTVCEIALR